MRLMFYNRKGGVGKSTLAFNVARALGTFIVTNDPNCKYQNFMDEGDDFVLSKKNSAIPLPVWGEEYDVVYDFGGFDDERIFNDVLPHIHACVVPLLNGQSNDWESTLETIEPIAVMAGKPVLLVHIRTLREPEDTLFYEQIDNLVPTLDNVTLLTQGMCKTLRLSLSSGISVDERIDTLRQEGKTGVASNLYKRSGHTIDTIIDFARQHNEH